MARLRERYGRDVVDRAHESVTTDSPEIDGDPYVVAVTSACERIAEIDRAADAADEPTMVTLVIRYQGDTYAIHVASDASAASIREDVLDVVQPDDDDLAGAGYAVSIHEDVGAARVFTRGLTWFRAAREAIVEAGKEDAADRAVDAEIAAGGGS